MNSQISVDDASSDCCTEEVLFDTADISGYCTSDDAAHSFVDSCVSDDVGVTDEDLVILLPDSKSLLNLELFMQSSSNSVESDQGYNLDMYFEDRDSDESFHGFSASSGDESEFLGFEFTNNASTETKKRRKYKSKETPISAGSPKRYSRPRKNNTTPDSPAKTSFLDSPNPSKSAKAKEKLMTPDVNKAQVQSSVDEDDSIGPYCDSVRCTISWLETGKAMLKPVEINNGMVFEFDEFAKKIAWESEYIARWIMRLQGFSKFDPSSEDMKQIQSVLKRRKQISITFAGMASLKRKLSSFDTEPFLLHSLGSKPSRLIKSAGVPSKLTRKRSISPTIMGAHSGSIDKERITKATSDHEKESTSYSGNPEKLFVFPVGNNYIGDHCRGNKIDISLLNSNEKAVGGTITNGVVYELYHFFIDHGQTLTSLARTLFRLKGIPLQESKISSTLTNLHNLVRKLTEEGVQKNPDLPYKDFDLFTGVSISSGSKFVPLPFEPKKASLLQSQKSTSILMSPLPSIPTPVPPPITSPNQSCSPVPSVASQIAASPIPDTEVLVHTPQAATLTPDPDVLINPSPAVSPTPTRDPEVLVNPPSSANSSPDPDILENPPSSATPSPDPDILENPPSSATPSPDPEISVKTATANTVLPTPLSVKKKRGRKPKRQSNASHIAEQKLQATDSARPQTPDVPSKSATTMDGRFDLNQTLGADGEITRGDIVNLYTKWLKRKMNPACEAFVSDLAREVVDLQKQRHVDNVHIPVGTLMSSSVKLFNQFRQLTQSNPEDAKTYLLEDWMEDVKYLVKSVSGEAQSTDDSSEAMKKGKRKKRQSASHDSHASSTPEPESSVIVTNRSISKICEHKIIAGCGGPIIKYKVQYEEDTLPCSVWIAEEAIPQSIINTYWKEHESKEQSSVEAGGDSEPEISTEGSGNTELDAKKSFKSLYIDSLDPALVNYQLETHKEEGRRVKVSKREVFEIYNEWRAGNIQRRKEGSKKPIDTEAFKGKIKFLMDTRRVRNFNPNCLLDTCYRMYLMCEKLSAQEVKTYLEGDYVELMEASTKHLNSIREDAEANAELSKVGEAVQEDVTAYPQEIESLENLQKQLSILGSIKLKMDQETPSVVTREFLDEASSPKKSEPKIKGESLTSLGVSENCVADLVHIVRTQ